jgi:hypothetical protein
MRNTISCLALAAVLAAPVAARADSGFRCATGRLVSVGDRATEVLGRCGEPDSVIQRVEKRKVKHRITRRVGNVEESIVEEREVEVPIEEWLYDMGRSVLTRSVILEGGQVVDVVTGGYGNK